MDERKRLQRVLAAYGADPQRWPAADRKLAALLGEVDRGEALEIDALLARARPPVLPAGSHQRLAQRLKPPSHGSNVIPLTPRPAAPRFRPLWAGAALAASLAIGVYIGTTSLTDDLVDGIANRDEPLDLIGLGDAEALAEDDSA